MQLTHFTDLGLRVLMYLGHQEPDAPPVTISEIADSFGVSRNHLVKVVHFMGKEGWITTARGKGGGMALAHAPKRYKLGEIIRVMEGKTELIDCAVPPCKLRGRCHLKHILDEAMAVFFKALDRHTLADALASPTGEAIVMLHHLRPPSPHAA